MLTKCSSLTDSRFGAIRDFASQVRQSHYAFFIQMFKKCITQKHVSRCALENSFAASAPWSFLDVPDMASLSLALSLSRKTFAAQTPLPSAGETMPDYDGNSTLADCRDFIRSDSLL